MNQMEVKRKRFSIISNIIILLNILVLSGVLGEHGIAYLAGTLECFFFLLVFTAYTLPEAMARLMRTRLQKGQGKNAMRVFNAALILGGVYCIIGSVCLQICADFVLEYLFDTVYGAYALSLLIPAYCLLVFAQVLRGFFQGMGTCIPTGISKIIESIILFATGIFFCFLLKEQGGKIAALLHNDELVASYSSAGVSIGFIAAELFSVLFLFFVFQTNKRNINKGNNKDAFRMTERYGELIYILILTMLPQMAAVFLSRAGIWGGMILFRLTDRDISNSIGIYGAFYGKYLTIILLCVLIIRLSVVKIEGYIQNAYRKNEYKTGKEWIVTGSHMVLLAGLFMVVTIAVLGNSLLDVLFKENSGNAGSMLMAGSSLILFMSLGSFFSNALISQGKIKRVLLNQLGGVIIFFVYAIISNGVWHKGIDRIVIGLCVSNGIVMLGAFLMCIRLAKWKTEWINNVVIPVGCAALTGIIVMLLDKALVTITGTAISVLICVVVGLLVYGVLLLAFRALREEEFEVIPGGRILYRIAEMLHFL